jgi:hypothetical protein
MPVAIATAAAAIEPECPLEPACTPQELVENAEVCSRVIEALTPDDAAMAERILDWLLPHLLPLATSQHATHVLQKLIRVLDCRGNERLVTALAGSAIQPYYESKWANWVLATLVEVTPVSSLGHIVRRIVEQGPVNVAMHRFGCRLLERLIESGAEEDIMTDLVDPLICAAPGLAEHKNGNFVMQSLMEHGTENHRKGLLRNLLPSLPWLASLKTSSNVAQVLLRFSDQDEQLDIANAFLGSEAFPLEQLAASRFGSFVVEDLLAIAGEISGKIQDRLDKKPKERSAFAAIVAARGQRRRR